MRKKDIIKLIKGVEKKHNIKIIWAIESGSRAWGWQSNRPASRRPAGIRQSPGRKPAEAAPWRPVACRDKAANR